MTKYITENTLDKWNAYDELSNYFYLFGDLIECGTKEEYFDKYNDVVKIVLENMIGVKVPDNLSQILNQNNVDDFDKKDIIPIYVEQEGHYMYCLIIKQKSTVSNQQLYSVFFSNQGGDIALQGDLQINQSHLLANGIYLFENVTHAGISDIVKKKYQFSTSSLRIWFICINK